MRNIKKQVFSSIFLLVLFFSSFRSIQTAHAACSGVIYVNANSNAVSPDGCSWTTAYPNLQDALAVSAAEDEIWVATGTYFPDDGTGQINDNRASTFRLKNGVAVYGGFAGAETARSQRNPSINVTVLSGDIGALGTAIDNAYQVVSIIGSLSDVYVLDGFTISGGNSNGSSGHGGGIYIQNASPTLTNLVITSNQASANGAGVYVISLASVRVSYSSPSFSNVVISNNTAARGGGLYTQNSSPVLNNVSFIGNTATSGAGGGMNNQVLNASTDEHSIPLLNNVTFNGNSARGGAGLFNNHSYPVLTNVTFSGNTASIRGGAVLNEGASPTFRNVTFTGNSAPVGTGGAIRNVINASGSSSNPQIYNSISWGNGSDEITSDGTGSTSVTDSIIQGGFSGMNVLSVNPLLAPLANNGGFTQTHALNAGSPAIDAGGANSACATSDQRGVTRPQGSACDMGAYEYDGFISSTPTFTPTSAPTSTFTSTPVLTNTAAPTATSTPTFVPSATATNTPVASPASTSTSTTAPTFTNTPAVSPTFTTTSTAVPTFTSTPVPLPTNTPSGTATVYRVAVNGSTNASCGASWANPCDLQYVLTLAGANSELWVKQGVYLPGNNRTSTFQLKNGVSIYGGFAGTETFRGQRNPDPTTNNTVLSGDIGTPGAIADNAYNVVTVIGNLSQTFLLDGFTVSGGNSNGGVGHGGGIYIQDASPAFANLIVRNNSASANGGGVYVKSIASLRVNYSSPTFTNVIIRDNTAARGGGLYTQNASPVLLNVSFSGNLATSGAGGGMNNQVLDEIVDDVSIPVLTNVTFSGNTANGGGGMFNNNSNPVLTNITFSGNTANIRGGAMLNEGGSPVLRNVTITGNTAPAGTGGAFRNILNAVGETSRPQIYNSILWDNGTEEITGDGTGALTLVDSIVEGGCPSGGTCTNVINANPLLGLLANNGGFTQTHALGAASSAIDAGGINAVCATVDQRGVTRPQGSACDIGSYEADGVAPSTPTLVLTSTFTITPQPPTATVTAAPSQTFTPSPTFTATDAPTFTPTRTPTATLPPTSTPTSAPVTVLYVSSTTGGVAGSISFADEDILAYNTVTRIWSMYFDGSDVGITSDVDAFHILFDGTILLSLDADVNVSGLGAVDDSDIIHFTPTSLGANTSGTFSMYFDGSDVGLSTADEDVDAFGFTPDGRLVFSTIGVFGVPGVSGGDEDLIAFTPTTLGANTSGAWSLYFDGSDVGLNEATSEDINAVWIDPANGRIHLSTLGNFSVTALSGLGSDVFICTPGSLGNVTTCTYSSYWIGTSNGFSGEIVDSLMIVR